MMNQPNENSIQSLSLRFHKQFTKMLNDSILYLQSDQEHLEHKQFVINMIRDVLGRSLYRDFFHQVKLNKWITTSPSDACFELSLKTTQDYHTIIDDFILKLQSTQHNLSNIYSNHLQRRFDSNIHFTIKETDGLPISMTVSIRVHLFDPEKAILFEKYYSLDYRVSKLHHIVSYWANCRNILWLLYPNQDCLFYLICNFLNIKGSLRELNDYQEDHQIETDYISNWFIHFIYFYKDTLYQTKTSCTPLSMLIRVGYISIFESYSNILPSEDVCIRFHNPYQDGDIIISKNDATNFANELYRAIIRIEKYDDGKQAFESIF
ncbi:hypothetical protein BC833DRAFT_601160 [Globomyces pollinis-pini]|nr:hypothetical protein BC833DRAFT_601160 [Globomyces pollinis-pini]